MPAFVHSACVFGAPAKAGALNATTRPNANIETRVFICYFLQCRDCFGAGTTWCCQIGFLGCFGIACGIAGGPKGEGLKAQIEAGQYPGIVKTTLDGVNQRAYLEGASETSARDFFFYFSGSTPSAVRYKNWKMYYSMAQPGADGWVQPLVNYHFTVVQNIKRDPFEQAIGALPGGKSALSTGGSLGAPMSAFQYDFNILPAGQMLWLRHLETYGKDFRRCRLPRPTTLLRSWSRSKKPILTQASSRSRRT